MKKTILTQLFLALGFLASAQTAIILENGSRFEMWDNIDSAKVHLETGDTMYIPGGSFNIGTWEITENNVAIIGAGHDPDSANVTGNSYLSGSISIKNGADNIALTGLYITSNVFIGTDQKHSDHVLVSYCNVSSITVTSTNGPWVSNLSVLFSVIRQDISGGYCTRALIFGNFIGDDLSYFKTSGVKISYNQIFTSTSSSGSSSNILYGMDAVEISNNIFHESDIGDILNGNSNCIGKNNSINISTTPTTPFQTGSSIFINSYGKITFDGTNQYWGLNSGIDFNDEDFQLDSGQPNVGPFAAGFKPGSVPTNPHIYKAVVAPQSDGNGRLPIQFRIRAED